MSTNPQVNLPPMGTSSVYSSNQVQELRSVQELRWSASIANLSLIAWQDAPGARNTYAVITNPGEYLDCPVYKTPPFPAWFRISKREIDFTDHPRPYRDLTLYVQAYNLTVSIGGLNPADTPPSTSTSTTTQTTTSGRATTSTSPPQSSAPPLTPLPPPPPHSQPNPPPPKHPHPNNYPASRPQLHHHLDRRPSSAITDPAAQCFLHNTPFGPQYTASTWHTALPTPAQSYPVSLNAHNTAACTAAPSSSSPTSPSSISHPSTATGELSTGAKAGIGVGAGIEGIVAIAGLVGLAVWWRRRRQGVEGPPVELGMEKGRVEGDAGVYAYQAPPQEMWGDDRTAHEIGVGAGVGAEVRGIVGREFEVGVGCVVQWFSGTVNVVLQG